MNITVIGCGYVGLVTAAGLGEFGHRVKVVETNRAKLALLNQGKIPIYEPGLEELVRRNVQENRLCYTDNIKTGVKNSQVLFIAVGTPARSDGTADLSQVKTVARQIAEYIEDYTIIVNKSTVPIGTGKLVREIIGNNQKRSCTFDVVSNPEFLREGSAVKDFLEPERVVIGSESSQAEVLMREVYQKLVAQAVPLIFTNLETAELIKYASNAFLATKISFINEIARLCDQVDADVIQVARGMGLDSRIGPQFLNPGPGYGGSCFPKDTQALVAMARALGERLPIVEAVATANEFQKQYMFQKIQHVVGELRGKTLAVLGLAFKANTDDIRESPAISIVENLLKAGAQVKAHDPEAIPEAVKIFGERIHYSADLDQALAGSDGVIIVTEWDAYKNLDIAKLKNMLKNPVVIDLRNILTPELLRAAGFTYEGIGRRIVG
jgi:UDPglucose 6-dehydrogenase